jgi:hypothetical protein
MSSAEHKIADDQQPSNEPKTGDQKPSDEPKVDERKPSAEFEKAADQVSPPFPTGLSTTN